MISLVSTIFNDRDGLETFFEAMGSQMRMPDEIVIVDAGSKDGTWELLQAESMRSDRPWKMKAIQEIRCNVARGRNLAIEAASGDLIVSTDIGCDWDIEWLDELVRPLLLDRSIEQVNGSWAVRREELSFPWALTEWALKGDQKLEATPESHCSSRSIAYRKNVWEALGRYPEDLTLAGDDAVYDYLSVRAGVKRAGAPKVRCYWHRHESLNGFFKEAFRYGLGDGEAAIRIKDSLLIGGRILLEAACLLLGVIMMMLPWGSYSSAGMLLIAVAALSVAAKVLKMKECIIRLKGARVDYPMCRLLIFSYGTKIHWLHGCLKGWARGESFCAVTRSRLNEMNPLIYRRQLGIPLN